MSKSTVEIEIAYLHALEEDSKILESLRIAGVKNWEGYDIAMEIIKENEDV